MQDQIQLQSVLTRIDGRGYKAYKDIAGSYQFRTFELFIDHVQGDPFAAPSKIRIRVPCEKAGFPENLFSTTVRRVALQDFLARQVKNAVQKYSGGSKGTGKSGMILIDAGAQEVLERTALVVCQKWVEARIYVGLPAAGRRILGKEAQTIFFSELPRIADNSLFWNNIPHKKATDFVNCIENQEFIRRQLAEKKLVAFVADGSILPRQSGATDLPMSPKNAIAFQSPNSLQTSFEVPHPVSTQTGTTNIISGMGIPQGVTLIVGGGYHGKSTLLNAIQRGVYPHIPGDGREYVVALRDAVKIRAEDGRSMKGVDISPFIGNLPYGKNTREFSTDDASGSTSQAGNIMESLEMGAQCLLLDEDTSATNFMVRDARMQALVHKNDEPITPFIDRVKEIYENFGVSTILVMGGCGDYFEKADTVIMMKEYLPLEKTESAKQIALKNPSGRTKEAPEYPFQITPRIPMRESFDPSRGRREVKIDAKSLGTILFGRDMINLSFVEQLVDQSQTRAVGYALFLASHRFMDGKTTLKDIIKAVEIFLDKNGMDVLDPYHRQERHPGSFARPRKYEIAAAINRMRTLGIKTQIQGKE